MRIRFRLVGSLLCAGMMNLYTLTLYAVSNENSENHNRLVEAVKFIASVVKTSDGKGGDKEVWLEMADPAHRQGKILNKYFPEWEKAGSSLTFLPGWMKKKNGSAFESRECFMTVLRR